MSDKLSELAKRRGFYFQSSEAYGGVSGFQCFGPEGAELKANVKEAWRQKFSTELGNREISAPNVMPEPVFQASGHLDDFDDMIVECPRCGASVRADHLVEDNTDIDEAEPLSTDQIEVLIEEHDLFCPECGQELAGVPVEDFNLMFSTEIGPGSGRTGYLRPETAQGIFVEFPRLKEYERNQLPFGITQIGRAYRNEISPRKGLVRTREFSQAELEYFIDPEDDEPRIEEVEDVELTLLSSDNQVSGEGPVEMTVGEAVESGTVDQWVAYFLGHAKQWYLSIGIDNDRLRFRQHQNDELAHYASDCWDAETEIGDDWLEIAGFTYRGCYDLRSHGEHSGDETDYQIFKKYDEPVEEEVVELNPDMGYFGPEFGSDAEKVVEELKALKERNPEAFQQDEIMLDIDGDDYLIPAEKAGFERKTVEKRGEHIYPHVVEPSFGIDRTIYSVLLHSLQTDEVDGEERNVLRLPGRVAPTEVAVLPLMDKDGMTEKAREVASELRSQGFDVEFDTTGNIGKRYRRQDEVGTPLCVTVDYETLEDEPETVTVRDRDTTEQERVETENLGEKLREALK